MRSFHLSVIVFLLFLSCAGEHWQASAKRDEQRLHDVLEIQFALRTYHDYHHLYPTGKNLVLARQNSECLSSMGFTNRGSSSGNTYLARVPGREFRYAYTQADSGRSYKLEFELETTTGQMRSGWHMANSDVFISW